MNLPYESFLNQSNTQSRASVPSSSRIQPSSFSYNQQHHVVRRQQQQPLLSLLSAERDVLCGRGKAFVDRPANRKFANIIKDNLHSYINAKSRKGKTTIVASIVNQLQANGIRFLKPKSHDGRSSSSARFYELNVFEAREKTGHALRDLIKQAGKKKKNKKTKKNPKSNATTTSAVTSKYTTSTTQAINNNNDDTSNICNSNNNNHLHHRERRTTLLVEPTRFHYSESLTMESLMEFGVFDLDDDDAMLKATSYNNKTDSSRSCESYTPLPASSSTTASNNIAIKLADILKINDILSSCFTN